MTSSGSIQGRTRSTRTGPFRLARSHGIAIDVASHRIFSSCSNNVLVVIDYDNGNVVATMPIGSKTDAAGFDPMRKRVFSSNGDGTLSVIPGEQARTISFASLTFRRCPARKPWPLTLSAAAFSWWPRIWPPTRMLRTHGIRLVPGTVKLLILDPRTDCPAPPVDRLLDGQVSLKKSDHRPIEIAVERCPVKSLRIGANDWKKPGWAWGQERKMRRAWHGIGIRGDPQQLAARQLRSSRRRNVPVFSAVPELHRRGDLRQAIRFEREAVTRSCDYGSLDARIVHPRGWRYWRRVRRLPQRARKFRLPGAVRRDLCKVRNAAHGKHGP